MVAGFVNGGMPDRFNLGNVSIIFYLGDRKGMPSKTVSSLKVMIGYSYHHLIGRVSVFKMDFALWWFNVVMFPSTQSPPSIRTSNEVGNIRDSRAFPVKPSNSHLESLIFSSSLGFKTQAIKTVYVGWKDFPSSKNICSMGGQLSGFTQRQSYRKYRLHNKHGLRHCRYGTACDWCCLPWVNRHGKPSFEGVQTSNYRIIIPKRCESNVMPFGRSTERYPEFCLQ